MRDAGHGAAAPEVRDALGLALVWFLPRPLYFTGEELPARVEHGADVGHSLRPGLNPALAFLERAARLAPHESHARIAAQRLQNVGNDGLFERDDGLTVYGAPDPLALR